MGSHQSRARAARLGRVTKVAQPPPRPLRRPPNKSPSLGFPSVTRVPPSHETGPICFLPLLHPAWPCALAETAAKLAPFKERFHESSLPLADVPAVDRRRAELKPPRQRISGPSGHRSRKKSHRSLVRQDRVRIVVRLQSLVTGLCPGGCLLRLSGLLEARL